MQKNMQLFKQERIYVSCQTREGAEKFCLYCKEKGIKTKNNESIHWLSLGCFFVYTYDIVNNSLVYGQLQYFLDRVKNDSSKQIITVEEFFKERDILRIKIGKNYFYSVGKKKEFEGTGVYLQADFFKNEEDLFNLKLMVNPDDIKIGLRKEHETSKAIIFLKKEFKDDKLLFNLFDETRTIKKTDENLLKSFDMFYFILHALMNAIKKIDKEIKIKFIDV